MNVRASLKTNLEVMISPDRLRQVVYVRHVCFRLRLQTIDATHALNLSAGVSNPNVSLGLSFNRLATAFNLACE